jgi:hypothetical protein
MTNDGKPSRLAQFAQITQAASGISVIVGICVAVFGIYSNFNTLKLSGLTPVKEMIEEDNAVRKEMDVFLKKYNTEEKVVGIIPKYGNGELAYTAEPGLRDVGPTMKSWEHS